MTAFYRIRKAARKSPDFKTLTWQGFAALSLCHDLTMIQLLHFSYTAHAVAEGLNQEVL
jgi:hypothetical protein